jgi:hypothetical protein
MAAGSGVKDDPWRLKTPPQTSEFEVWRDEAASPAILFVQVGATRTPVLEHLGLVELEHAPRNNRVRAK